jgi:hypothetical protein
MRVDLGLACCKPWAYLVASLLATDVLYLSPSGHADMLPLCMSMGCPNGGVPIPASPSGYCWTGVTVAYFCLTQTGRRQLCYCQPAPVDDETDDDTDDQTGDDGADAQ